MTNLEIADRVATIRFVRSEHGNSFDTSAAIALRDAVRRVASESDVAAVAFAADGPLFCAGGDVHAMAGAAARGDFVRQLADVLHEALIALRALPVPIVAIVQGTTAGAGIGLLLAADIVVASDSAKFVAAYSRIGLSPDCGVSALLPAVVGVRRAAEFLLTDRVLDAPTAVEWGLITECVPREQLAVRAQEILTQLADGPPRSLGEAARLLRFAPHRAYAAQLADEAQTIGTLAEQSAAASLIATFAAG
jgi:2-(1,2-epoxy-1,2-dihydrophenyl)acetyl-CoA isomerase